MAANKTAALTALKNAREAVYAELEALHSIEVTDRADEWDDDVVAHQNMIEYLFILSSAYNTTAPRLAQIGDALEWAREQVCAQLSAHCGRSSGGGTVRLNNMQLCDELLPGLDTLRRRQWRPEDYDAMEAITAAARATLATDGDSSVKSG
jgi:hypothetical protein